MRFVEHCAHAADGRFQHDMAKLYQDESIYCSARGQNCKWGNYKADTAAGMHALKKLWSSLT